MSIENCRGQEAKQNIVNNYELEPIIYVKLLEGQNRQGCCGVVTDKYYFFKATHKITQDIEDLIVGYDCANQFLELIGHQRLRLFNPLQGQANGNGGDNDEGGNNIQMAPLNKELSNAIHLLCCAWGRVPSGSLKNNLDYIRSRPDRPTNDFAIINFNRIISYDNQGRTLTEIIDDLRIDNPNLRQFTFNNMELILQNSNEVSHL